ncbi:hypothetical protein SDC9_171965 [bioreactor metagenome]|uniref:Uncharacterized protein n=1 Tax=bioreactor metagenome TaxID=1076179 RepID=A0A645GEI7_9ZZZZ
MSAVHNRLFLPVQPRALPAAIHQIMQNQQVIMHDPYADRLSGQFLDFFDDSLRDFQAHIMRKCFKLKLLFLFQYLDFVHCACTFPLMGPPHFETAPSLYLFYQPRMIPAPASASSAISITTWLCSSISLAFAKSFAWIMRANSRNSSYIRCGWTFLSTA